MGFPQVMRSANEEDSDTNEADDHQLAPKSTSSVLLILLTIPSGFRLDHHATAVIQTVLHGELGAVVDPQRFHIGRGNESIDALHVGNPDSVEYKGGDTISPEEDHAVQVRSPEDPGPRHRCQDG